MRSLPPLDGLHAALTAAETGSLSAAATALGVTHATISRRISGLETWSGSRIFRRHGRGVQPTLDGQRLLTRLGQIFDDMERLVAQDRRPRGQRIVRLAVTPSFARFWVLPRLTELETEGDLRIELVTEQLNVNLGAGEADIAIRYGKGGWKLGVEHSLFNEVLVPVAPKATVASMGRVTATKILSLPLLNDSTVVMWRAWARQNGITYRAKEADRIFGGYDLAIEAAISGIGISLWNSSLHSLDPRLQVIPMASALPLESPLRHILIVPDQASPSAIRLAARIVQLAGA
jgi:LysR family transcriptional regulator, glycine cleavage system transcriptional activator